MMKWISTIYLGLTLAVSFAQTPPAETNFQQPGRVETKLFVPPDVMKGPSHSVSSEAENDGLNNTYILYSGGDAWSVDSTPALRTRIKEIYAIEKLREMKKTQEFAKAIANARAQALGGLVVSAATAVAGGPAGTVLTGLNVNQTLQQTLVNSTPNDLRILNRKKLFALGVSRADADEILMHPWYSPWAETVIIDALSNVGVDPTAFLARASRALTEQDAVYFQRLAQVLAAYAQKTQLRSIRVESGVVSAQDVNGKVVIRLSCDYGIWSEQNADRFNGFAKAVQGDSDVKGLMLWVDGKISDDAQQQLKQRNVEVATEVLTKGD